MSVKTCPRCCRTLRRAKGPGMALDICMDCGGTHFDHGELAKMAREHPDELDDVERLVERHPYSIKIVISRELPCADCGTPMATYEYALTSGVLLDRCPKCCAVWADDGELQAIQDHIEGRPDPGTEGEEALSPGVRAHMLLDDMRAGSWSKTGRLKALASLCTALTRRPFAG
jgi:Zn-finger nucleic acid-binding protein